MLRTDLAASGSAAEFVGFGIIGLRATAFIAPLGGVLAAAILWWSPVRGLRTLPVMDRRSPGEIAVDAERDQPVGA